MCDCCRRRLLSICRAVYCSWLGMFAASLQDVHERSDPNISETGLLLSHPARQGGGRSVVGGIRWSICVVVWDLTIKMILYSLQTVHKYSKLFVAPAMLRHGGGHRCCSSRVSCKVEESNRSEVICTRSPHYKLPAQTSGYPCWTGTELTSTELSLYANQTDPGVPPSRICLFGVESLISYSHLKTKKPILPLFLT